MRELERYFLFFPGKIIILLKITKIVNIGHIILILCFIRFWANLVCSGEE